MTLNENPSTPPSHDGWFEPGRNNIQLIYVLYLASVLVGITALIGVVMAYVNRGKAAAWVETHYIWAIRTFWIGLLYFFISAVLAIVLIGYLLMLLVAIWAIVRVIVGLQKASREEQIANPQSWLF